MLGDIINYILTFISDLIEPAFNILPDSPIQTITFANTAFGNVMGWINYFVPLQGMLLIMSLYLSAALIWYGVRWLMRLGKYID